MNVLIGHVRMVESVSTPEEAMSALAQKLIREIIASEVTAQLLTLNDKTLYSLHATLSRSTPMLN